MFLSREENKMEFDNEMTLIINSNSKNEALARVSVAAFVTQLNPTVAEITDIKTAVSEAVTNAIIHGYENLSGKVYIDCKISGKKVIIEISDNGKGTDDIEEAITPLFTSKPDLERSGMGFTVMEIFMDEMSVESNIGQGTKIILTKEISDS